ncbi:coth protein-domain-containing protein [Pilobolus umbonatus]|nr:coth protein-domain-containing protein [Pilobolus umbonatus]
MKRTGLLLILCALTSVFAQNIVYNVIAEASANHSVSVIVDKKAYPLVPTSGVLYQGEAPIARSHYYYSMTVNSTVVIKESFKRKAVKVNTPNEFFDRPQNKYKINKLPQILPDIPSRNEIDTKLHRIDEIPTIHIFGDQADVDELHVEQEKEVKKKLSFTYIGLDTVQTFDDVTVELAGRSSRWVPKVSYTLKMKNKGDSSLYGYKRFKLRALAIDSSHIREQICYSVGESLGLTGTGFSFARVFINGRAVGIFGFIETYQDPWLANKFAGGDTKYKSGYLYQGSGYEITTLTPKTFADLTYLEGNYTLYSSGQYKIKAGPSEDFPEDYAELDNFTKFIHFANENTTADEWNAVIDAESFIRSMVIENLLGLSDAYMSFANNYYLYKNPAENGRITFISADTDTTLGLYLYDKALLLSGDYTKHPGFASRPLTKKFFMVKEFLAQYENLLQTVHKKLTGNKILTKQIDAVVKMITPDVEWDETLPRLGKKVNVDTGSGDLGKLFQVLLTLNPGINLNSSVIHVPFRDAIYGPTDPAVNAESVMDFLKIKSNAVKAFFKKPKKTKKTKKPKKGGNKN